MSETVAAGFLSRKRFLITNSLALAVVQYLGLQFHKINVLGNEAVLSRADNISALGWLAWVAALITYLQWFHDYDAWGHTRQGFRHWRDRLLPRAMRGRASEVPTEVVDRFRQERKSSSPDREPSIRIEPAGVGVREGKWHAAMRLQAILPAETFGEQGLGSSEHHLISVPRSLVISRSLLAVLATLFVSRYFSEFFMPIAIAAIPPILRLTGWHG